MRFVSKQQIHEYFDHVSGTLDDLTPHMLQARDPVRDGLAYDYAGLLAKGMRQLFAPMATRLPKAHAALMAIKPEMLVAERTHNAIGRDIWSHDAFVGSGDRFFRLGAYFRDDSIAAVGERSVYWFRYASLPPAIAEAYYADFTGMEVVHQLPGSPLFCRGLPAMITTWLRADEVAGTGKKNLQAIKAGFAAVADPDTPVRKHQLVWESFACVLDSRQRDADGSAGDLLFVQERSATRRLFHVHDANFAEIRHVDDPVRLYDDYMAWVFAGGARDFDFSSYSRPA